MDHDGAHPGISRVVALGYPNPRPIAAAAVVAAAIWALWRARRSRDLSVMLACAAFIVHAYFVLGVQVHENHLYLAIPLLARRRGGTPRLRPVFSGVSIAFALNLWLFFGLGRGFPPPPRNLTMIDTTVLLAVANCVLLIVHARRLSGLATRHHDSDSIRTRTASRDPRTANRELRYCSTVL